MELYSYQKQVIEAVFADCSPSKLVSMPTGTGKTITFLSVAKSLPGNVLILVHRNELLCQTKEKALALGISDEDISTITADEKGKISKITVAMVPTLARNLNAYDPAHLSHIIIDEAHHATAPSYRKILDYFKIPGEDKTLIGFTATPLRGDKDQLSSIFGSHTFKMTLAEATQLGYIVPVYGVRMSIDKQLDAIETVAGDYDPKALEKVMNCDDINQLIADKCNHLKKTPAIVFCTSVDHAKKIAALIRGKSRKAISISYQNTPKGQARILDLLKQNRIDFITNAVKLSEGFDHPAIQTIIIARPTRSPVLYKQMIGRGLRLFPNKYDCLVVEFADNDKDMICWDDIDQNVTFQCYSARQKVSRDEAIKHYRNIYNNSANVKIIDVRISPIVFYECYIRRVCKYSQIYLFSPIQNGFTIFELFNVKDKSQSGNFFNVKVSIAIWKDIYKSFTFYMDSSPQWLWYHQCGHSAQDLKSRLDYFLETQKMGVWYPPDTSKPDGKLIRYAKDLNVKIETGNARKLQMDIEDKSIILCINKFYKKEQFSGLMTLQER